MSTLYITEYAELHMGAAGRLGQLPVEPPLTEQTVAIGVGSVQSAALNPVTQAVRLHSDAICSIAIGTNPTATTSSGRFAANQTEYRAVPRGGTFKIAVIANT